MTRWLIALCGAVLVVLPLSQAPAQDRDVRYNFTAAPSVGNLVSRYSGKQIVSYDTSEAPGTIIIDTSARKLFYVLQGGQAIAYGVGVGRQGFSWSGKARIARKAKWPTWTPPREMIAREPRLVRYADGMPGGPNNPLGARALYLFEGGRDTLYRIHGTNQAWSIGRAVSSGCIRMLNDEVIDLYSRVSIGTRVVVL